jgi:hypothetical protein
MHIIGNMKIRIRRNIVFFLAAIWLALAGNVSGAGSEHISLELPADLLRQTLQGMLPLPLAAENLQGKLEIVSIDRFEMRQDALLVKAVLHGTNVALQTRIGNQDLNLRLGELRFPLTCMLTFRFDPEGKILYVTPFIEPPPATENPQADAVLPLLALLGNREYPVPLGSLQPFQVETGGRDMSVHLDPVDFTISEGRALVLLKPRIEQKR